MSTIAIFLQPTSRRAASLLLNTCSLQHELWGRLLKGAHLQEAELAKFSTLLHRAHRCIEPILNLLEALSAVHNSA